VLTTTEGGVLGHGVACVSPRVLAFVYRYLPRVLAFAYRYFSTA
jgi:hypothetical protein